MTTPLKSPAGELPAKMDDTPPPSTARPHAAAGPAAAGESPPLAETVSPEASPPAASGPPGPDEPTPRSAAGIGAVSGTALLVVIVAAFLGVLGTAVGLPLYVLDGNIHDLGDEIDTLQDDFGELEDDFRKLEDKMDARFAEQDAKIDAKFAEQDAKFDAKFDELEKGQAEIDRKLTALIAHLNSTEAVEDALEGRIE